VLLIPILGPITSTENSSGSSESDLAESFLKLLAAALGTNKKAVNNFVKISSLVNFVYLLAFLGFELAFTYFLTSVKGFLNENSVKNSC
jgi:hypothetical protein